MHAMKTACLVFPGSNCDRDAQVALRLATGNEPAMVWHKETTLPDGLDLIVVPGGFSYGDYLRAGAMAAQSPVMRAVKGAAARGVRVIGICNGFQILTEAGLLPGALLRNASMKFVCRDVYLRVENRATPFTHGYGDGAVVKMPIAHADGNYYADEATLDRMTQNGQIAFRYCAADGNLADDANPNGSQRHIAGVLNEAKNVLGMMPHPERAFELAHGNQDGTALFQSLMNRLS